MSARWAGFPLAWWLALCVLALNDHVLKGSGLLPGVVTGKLSDFAGLIVAPILGCTALGLRSERARSALFGVVALAFAAIKLDVRLADAAAGVLTQLGVPSRIWCDPTDLVALCVLPYAFLLARSAQPIARVWAGGLRQRCAIALAAVACIATSDDEYPSAPVIPPLLINWTHANVAFEIEKRFWACEDGGTEEDAPRVQQSVSLGTAEMVSLGEQDEVGEPRPCGSARIEMDGQVVEIEWGPELAVDEIDYRPADDWDSQRVAVEANDDWAFERAVTVIGAARNPTLVIGDKLQERR